MCRIECRSSNKKVLKTDQHKGKLHWLGNSKILQHGSPLKPIQQFSSLVCTDGWGEKT